MDELRDSLNRNFGKFYLFMGMTYSFVLSSWYMYGGLDLEVFALSLVLTCIMIQIAMMRIFLRDCVLLHSLHMSSPRKTYLLVGWVTMTILFLLVFIWVHYCLQCGGILLSIVFGFVFFSAIVYLIVEFIKEKCYTKKEEEEEVVILNEPETTV